MLGFLAAERGSCKSELSAPVLWGSGEVCCISRREKEEPKKGKGRGRKGVLTLPSLPLLAKGRRGGGLARTEREEEEDERKRRGKKTRTDRMSFRKPRKCKD